MSMNYRLCPRDRFEEKKLVYWRIPTYLVRVFARPVIVKVDSQRYAFRDERRRGFFSKSAESRVTGIESLKNSQL